MDRAIVRGSVVLAILSPIRGHEQAGTRPCVVVSDDAMNAHQRFPLVVVVPLTSREQHGPLYPEVGPDPAASVRLLSYALTDQVRALDRSRVIAVSAAPLGPASMRRIDDALSLALGLR